MLAYVAIRCGTPPPREIIWKLQHIDVFFLRLLALRVALGLLALTLAYGIQQMQRSARRVDRTDQVLGHANKLVKLIVSEET